MAKTSFILHLDSLIILNKMPDEIAGKFIKILYQYQISGELPEMDFGLEMAVTPFINQFTRDKEKYGSTSESRRLSGKIGGLQKVANLANASKAKQKVANLADSDSDSDSDKDSKKEKDKEKDIKPTLEDVLQYYKTDLQKEFPSLSFSVQAKYESWVDQGWKDGNGSKITNWKLKLKNTIPHLKPMIGNHDGNGTQPKLSFADGKRIN